MWEDSKLIFKNPVFVTLVMGNTAYIFMIGGLSYWGPYLLEDYYGFGNLASVFLMGGITLLSGTVSVIIGSNLVDKRV